MHTAEKMCSQLTDYKITMMMVKLCCTLLKIFHSLALFYFLSIYSSQVDSIFLVYLFITGS